MGDEDDAHAEFLLQLAQEHEHLNLHGRVERGGRLVGEEQFRAAGQGDRDHGALPEATGQLMGIGLQPPLRRGNAHELEQFERARVRLLPAGAAMAHHRLLDLLADRVDGIERRHGILKDHRDLRAAQALHLAFAHRGDVVAVDEDLARNARAFRWMQFQEGAHRDRLARAGFTEDAQDLAGPQTERHVVYGVVDAFTADEFHVEVTDVDQQRVEGGGGACAGRDVERHERSPQ